MDFKNYDIDVTKLFITGVGTVVLAGLIGCCIGLTLGKKVKTQEGQMQQIETTQETDIEDNIKGNIQLGEEKTFAPGEHYICVRVSQHSNGYNNDSLPGDAISNIPEGYEVYTILSYTNKEGYGSTTGGYDVWFVNNKEVKVKATYNERHQVNGYYTFGEVVEKQKQLINK